MINFKDKILWLLVTILVIFGIGFLSITMVKIKTEEEARDKERVQGLKQVQVALELY